MTERPRVLLVNPADVIRPEIKYLVSALAGNKVEFHVLLTEDCDPSYLEKHEVSYQYYPASYLPKIRYTVPRPGFVRQVRDELQRTDIVHVIDYDYLPCATAAVMADCADIPAVITTDALPGISWSYGSPLVDMAARAYTETLGRVAFGAANRVICLGEYLRTDLADFTTETKIEMIPNGVDTEYFSPGRSEESNGQTKLLYVGRLDGVKNVTSLIRAVALLCDQSETGYVLTVVGDGNQRSECEKLVGSLNVESSVNIVGWQEVVKPYYTSHDIFVLPSVSEGLSNVLMEAQACGLPVVTTDVGGAREVVGAGAVVRPRDHTAIADGIEQVNQRRSPELSQSARDHIVQNYSLNEMGKSYRSLYDDLRGSDTDGSNITENV